MCELVIIKILIYLRPQNEVELTGSSILGVELPKANTMELRSFRLFA